MDDGGRSKGDHARQIAPKLELTPAMEQFINSFGLFFEAYAVPKIGGRLMGLLLLAGQPLTAEDMATLLKVSRASISMNIRLLIAGGIAERAHVSGDRRDFYQLPQEGLELALKVNLDGAVAMRKLAELGMDALKPSHPGRRDMEEFSDISRFMERYFTSMLEDWRKYKAERKASEQTRASNDSPHDEAERALTHPPVKG